MRFLNRLVHPLGFHVQRYRYYRHIHEPPAFVDRDFVEAWQRFKDKTLVSWSVGYATYAAAKYAEILEGDIVECGVWKGGCSLLMAAAGSKTVWMYDTFSGMPEPSERDRRVGKGKESIGEISDLAVSKETVETVIRESGLPAERFRLVQGKVEDTVPGLAPSAIAVLRLDTDWYSSTRHELVHLYPRLVRGGVLLVDDYGWFQGAREAVDEYFEEHGIVAYKHIDRLNGALAMVKP